MKQIDHSIPPQGKNKQWISDYIRAAWNDFSKNNSDMFYNGRESFHEIRQYMLGQQPISKYKKLLAPDDDGNEDTTWMNIDWAILPIVPKFRRMIIDIVKKLRYKPTVHAIDSLAQEDQDKYYAEKAAEIMMREEFKKRGLDPALIGIQDNTAPQDFDELEMEMQYSWKDNQAKDVETILDQIFENSRYDEIRDRLITDITDIGVACVEDYVDFDGEILAKYRDPADMVVPYCEEPDFSDAEYMGDVRLMTIAQVENLLDDQEKTSEEWNELKDLIKDKAPSDIEDGKTVGNKFRVLHLKFLSDNHQIFEFRKDESGKVFWGKKTSGKKNKEFVDAYFDVVYEGYWVIETDMFFGCKLATNMKRDPANLKETTLPYHIYAPDLYGMTTYSLGQQMVSISDAIQIAHYKLQNAIIRSRPRGVMYELSSIQNVQVAGEDISAMDIIKAYNYTGNFGYRRVDEDGEVAPWRPIEELQGGIGEEGQQWFGVIANNIQLLREITGLNEITDGSGPDPKMLKSVAQLASLSTNNALRYIHTAEKKLTDRVGTDLMLRIQDAAKDGNLEIYRKSVGSNTIKHVVLSSDVSYRKLGLVFEEEPTQEDKERLARRIELALQPQGEHPPQITLDDAVFVERISNLRMAEQYLAYRVKKNRERNDEHRLRLVQENSKAQQESAVVAEKARQETMMMDGKIKGGLIDKEKQWDYRIEIMKSRAKVGEESIKAQARQDESIRSSNTKDLISDRQEQTKRKTSASKADAE